MVGVSNESQPHLPNTHTLKMATNDDTLDVILQHQDWGNPNLQWSNNNKRLVGKYPRYILQFAENLPNLHPDVLEIESIDGNFIVRVDAPNVYVLRFSRLVRDFRYLLDHLNEFPHINYIILFFAGINVMVENRTNIIKIRDIGNIGDSFISEIINQYKNIYTITILKLISYQTRYINHPNVSYQIEHYGIWIIHGCIYMSKFYDPVDYVRFFDCVDDVRYIQLPSIMVAVEDMVNRFWAPLFNFVQAHPNIKLGAYHIPRPMQQQQQDWWFTLPQFDNWENIRSILSYHDRNVRGLVPKYKGYVLNRKDEMNDGGILIIHTLNMSIAMLNTIKNQIEKTPLGGIWVYNPHFDRIDHAQQIQFKLMTQSYHLGMELSVDERQFEDNAEMAFNQLSSNRTRAEYYGHDLFNTIPIHFIGQIPIVDHEGYNVRNLHRVVNQGIIFYRLPRHMRTRGSNYHLWDARIRSYGLIPYNSDTLDPPEFARSIIGFMYLYATYNRISYTGIRLSNDILRQLKGYLFHLMNRDEVMNSILDRVQRSEVYLLSNPDLYIFGPGGM